MGWWNTTAEGDSFAVDSALVWGDGPADLMGDALQKIIEEFGEAWDRPPTMEELTAGLRFSAPALLAEAQETAGG
ncbi:hypothetical protein B7435_16735 [Mycolicibacterium peregrinum]|uniref:Uncharacterized protein n=1 Tax=Mycolicibacterium alvei TaxID=67081 RepID=A0A6N4UZX3_9MYCO|nr:MULTISPECIES: hypothetical protein [Mycolicibacterium]MCV7003562.1 hypothetical protein [Mycolicibacterium alvei]OWM01210.1 hypothetical protein B7435_16735 [Mycolicibacterium peregrinum]BBX30480.1 hypothetical protein MALV_56050 [Mycolicibacterium alvei]